MVTPQQSRVPVENPVARYLDLQERHSVGSYNGHPDTPEIKSALVGAMANIWRRLGETDRFEIAVAMARKGRAPITIEEAAQLAALVDGDALRLRREAKVVAKVFVRGGDR